MPGYIAITTEEWIECIRDLNLTEAVFWCQKSSFKAIKQGDNYYFLRRSKFHSNADRFISGYGKFDKFEKVGKEKAWELYGNKLGFVSEEQFYDRVSSIYKYNVLEISCIVLKDIVFFDKEKSIEECGIDFSRYIVSGKIISDEECRNIEVKKS